MNKVFAETKEYLSSDHSSLGAIEIASVSEDKHLVSISYMTWILADKIQNVVMYIFKNYSDAKAYYDEKSTLEDFDSFYKFYSEVIYSEKYKDAKVSRFNNNGIITTVRMIDYDVPLVKTEVTSDKENDNYKVVTFKEISGNQDELNNTKISVFKTKLIGTDPIDSSGNIPALVRNEANDGLLLVMIPPSLRDFFYQNKNQSLNYYGTLMKKTTYTSYLLVEKITSN